jgi:hypothetical protein
MYSKPLLLPLALYIVFQRCIRAMCMTIVANLNGEAPWVIEIVCRIRRTKIMSCTSRSTCLTLDSCSSVEQAGRVEVAVLNRDRPLAPRP